LIKAIIFDFGNVICSLDNTVFLRRISGYTEKPVPELAGLIYGKSDLPRLYETGLIDSDRFFAGVVELCKLHIGKEEFIRAYTDIFTPIPATFELIGQLKAGYKLALLSNTSEWDFEYGIKPIEIFDLFDTVTLSYEVKVMKPERRIYMDVLRKLKCAPRECVYIDDIEANAAAAREIGIHGFCYISPEQLAADLKSLGIRV
jgi:putative hydrolase of the HAD superfamily